MTQLAPQTRAEADALHAVLMAYARPHIEAAAMLALQASRDLAQIAEHVPAGIPEAVHIAEVSVTLERYAQLLGLQPDAPLAVGPPSLGAARRTAIDAINARADQLLDAALIAWGRSLDLPVMDVRRLVEAATLAVATLAAKRARGEITADEAGQEADLQALQARHMELRAAQRDHVRAIDALDDIDLVASYPDTATWPA